MVAELKSTTHYGLSMRINTSSKVKVTTQFFNSVFVQPPDGRVRKTWTFSSDWFGSWLISSWWKLGILLDWYPHLCLAPAEASGLGIYCSLNEPRALLLVSASGSLKTSQRASRERESRESSRADNYNAYHKLAVALAEVWGSAIDEQPSRHIWQAQVWYIWNP